jgi:hypothetical protein
MGIWNSLKSGARAVGDFGANVVTLGGHGAAESQRKGLRAQSTALDSTRGDLANQRSRELASISEATDPFTRSASGDWQNMRSLASADNSQFNYDPFEQFDPASANQFLDPSIDFQVQQATNAIEGGAANRGKLGAGSTQKAIADRAQQIGQTGMQSAQDRAYADWQDRINMGRQAKDQGANLAQQRIGNAQGIAAQGFNASQNALTQRLGTNQAYDQNLNNLNMQQAGLQGQLAQVPNGAQQFGQALPKLIDLGMQGYKAYKGK